MNVPRHIMSEEAAKALESLTDNGTAQMSHVKGFGDVGAAVVDDDLTGCVGLFHAAAGIGQKFLQKIGKGLVCDHKIQKSRRGNLSLGIGIPFGKLIGQRLSDLQGRTAQHLRQTEGSVALKLAQVGAVGIGNADLVLGIFQFPSHRLQIFVQCTDQHGKILL